MRDSVSADSLIGGRLRKSNGGRALKGTQTMETIGREAVSRVLDRDHQVVSRQRE